MYNNYEDSDMIEINKNQLAAITRALSHYAHMTENLNVCLVEQDEQERIKTMTKFLQETKDIFMLMVTMFEEVLHNEN